ncbi:hypothetical protein CONPUDRAFT_166013 [Coniophora puteana RWD-64-598 SS2]|uniref:Uncharacterized protein n=1 Tax=Coniophora puteana (strain RWD-64-598) TaxID=741705 RepID=A0A5M3MN92_CONPW|nr:uncharacterized protein CONPUDRAFT_166013 [Coniophora puteana RWD-64-598 SS2]EIW80506.1 hypothetical protein CONPUDRAFT_166013 [Coniophora puteana RWD-64-598 SS2]
MAHQTPCQYSPLRWTKHALHSTHLEAMGPDNGHQHAARCKVMSYALAAWLTPIHYRNTPASISRMGQLLSALDDCPSGTQNHTVGGIWADHEFVVVPLDIAESSGTGTSATASSALETIYDDGGYDDGDDDTLSIISSAETLASYVSAETTAPLPSPRASRIPGPAPAAANAAGFVPVEYVIRSGGRGHSHGHGHGQGRGRGPRRSVMVTRTMVRSPDALQAAAASNRNANASSIREEHSWQRERERNPTSAPSYVNASRVTLPLPPNQSKTPSPLLKALNCFTSVQAFEPDDADFVTDMETPNSGGMTHAQRSRSRAPRVIEVVVRQTRDEYEDAAAMRKLAAEVYHGHAGHRPAAVAVDS